MENAFYFPVKLVFADDFDKKEEFLEKINHISDIKQIKTNFYGVLFDIFVEDDENFQKTKEFCGMFCNNFEHNETVVIEIVVENKSKEEGYEQKNIFTLFYEPNTFLEDIRTILSYKKQQFIAIINENNSWNLFKSVRTAFQTKLLADAYFYTNEFSDAEYYYKKIVKNYPTHTERMLGLIEYIKYKRSSSILLFDVFVLNDDTASMYNCVRFSNNVKYNEIILKHLAKCNMPDHKKLMVFFRLYKMKVEDKKEYNKTDASVLFEEIKRIIANLKCSVQEKDMWNKALERFDEK